MNAGNNDGGWSDLTKIIAAGTAFVGLLSGLAVAGIVGRFERNHSTLFIVACALVLAAAALWVVAALPKVQGRTEKWLQRLGVIVLLVGLVAALVGLARTQHDPNRPDIHASLEGNVLKGTVEASGLDAHDRVRIYVDGLHTGPLIGELGVKSFNTLYWAAVGANSDGDASSDFAVEIPNGLYDAVGIRAFTGKHSDCLQQDQRKQGGVLVPKDGPGCVVLGLPSPTAVPQLRTSWNGRTLEATATADQAGGDLIVLRILAFSAHGRRTIVYAHGIADRGGNAKLDETVTPPRGVNRVCVFAALANGDQVVPKASCSSKPIRAAAVLLTVPAS